MGAETKLLSLLGRFFESLLAKLVAFCNGGVGDASDGEEDRNVGEARTLRDRVIPLGWSAEGLDAGFFSRTQVGQLIPIVPWLSWINSK